MNRKNAFSLVELLVVISIIALLLAILLPALSRARQQARGVICLSNLHQLGIAASAYVANNQGYYPIGYYNVTIGNELIAYAWDFTSIKDWDTGTQKVIPGILWEGKMTLEKVQQCPCYKGSANWLSDPYTGYNYNISYIGHGSNEIIKQPLKAVEVRHPATCALFGDGEYLGGADKFMRSPLPWAGDTFSSRYSGTQGFRHLRRTNVIFCDGSARALAKAYVPQNDPSPRDIAPGTGFLSADNTLYDPN
jgi:prepilin-type N-terminal cleavage/methylation domain-containing protein/prepilin-type processing-associated H-X9-DG protein